MSTRLDPLQVPLTGITLIEANAGTGKTWTITALYLRLLLEARLGVESILVVTFTEMATAELRERIRTRLVEALTAFEGSPTEDPLLQGLVGRASDHAEACLRLTGALQDFDQAPIYTLHAFCQRVLGDRAFETGHPFETEIVADETLLLQEIVDDYWRRTLYGASPSFTRWVLARGITPEELRGELSGRLGKPYLQIRKPELHEDVPALEQGYAQAHAAARAIWRVARPDIGVQFAENRTLSASRYRSDWVAKWLQDIDDHFAADHPPVSLSPSFGKFTPHALEQGTRKGATPPRHPFYEACAALSAAHAALKAAYECRLSLMRVELLEFCTEQLVRRKRRLRLQSYDDLLLNVENALAREAGEQLAAALRERYPAALVDEFQDTDPIQYRIFQAMYRGSVLPVFLVGDPKQAIYSFRGADVFAYLAARRDAQRTYTLDVNWRSTGPLLAAVNTLFGHKPAPFVIDDIPFAPSLPAQGSRGQFEIDGEQGFPFEMWTVQGENGKPLPKLRAAALAAEATAAEIARLLRLGAAKRARITPPRNGDPAVRALCGGDIAVLVRKHAQAGLVREALRRFGIASVERGGESVFRSCEAEELQRVLVAVAEPGREARVRAALATEMLGFRGAALHAFSEDEAAWEEATGHLRAAHETWHKRGFIAMATGLFERYSVMERLLGFADGERRVTNIRHLVELMHRETGGLALGAALEWLAEKRRAPGGKNEEELLRLESDENLVKVLTVHAAKGLEFPLVFCPFTWDGLWSERLPAVGYHDPDAGYAAVLDFGSERADAARGLARREELAESVRLLYVALTRARHRCWMVWGHINGAATSAPAWLLHHPGGSQTLEAPLSVPGIERDLQRIEARSEGAVRVRPIPAVSEAVAQPASLHAATLAARPFAGSVRDTWRITSFTALAHARAPDAPDYDASARIPAEEAVADRHDIHAFPRGARTGRCLHAIFENVDFAAFDRGALEGTVGRQLNAYGFPARWVDVVSDMVEQVVATPLDATGRLRLERVDASRRLNELEFHYPIARMSDQDVRRLLTDWGFPDEVRERIDALEFAPAQGYMKGYIDLVFESEGRYYLADYKSNWLGPSMDAYDQTALCRAMAREAYYLQYLLYCVALHRYLGARLRNYSYEAHFGGVRYLFVRGMHPGQGCRSGVYAACPPAGLIEALDRYFSRG